MLNNNYRKHLLFYIILCTFFCHSSADIKEIKLTVYKENGELACWQRPLDIDVSDQFRVFVNTTETYLHNVARCRNLMNSDSIFNASLQKDKQRNGYTTNIYKKAKRSGAWDFECEFYTNKCTTLKSNGCFYKFNNNNNNYQDPGVKCSTKVYVHEKSESFISPEGVLSVNGANVASDYGHIHKFYEDEGATFQCNKINGNKVKLEYISRASRVISTDFQVAESVSMFIRLNTSNDGANLRCVTADELETRQHIVRIRLSQHRTRQGLLSFEVDGLILPLIKKMAGNEYYYEYNYYDGEIVNIFIAKDDEMYGEVTCNADGPEKLKTHFNGTFKTTNILVFQINKNDNGSLLFCDVKKLNTSATTYFYTKLRFLIERPTYSPYIKGLPKSNIILQYTNNTSNIIKYGIAENETLSLYCDTYKLDRPTTWFYFLNQVVTSRQYQVVPRPYQLQQNENYAFIRCVVNSSNVDKKTYLELYRRKTVATTFPAEILPTQVSSTTQSTALTMGTTATLTPNHKGSGNGTLWVIAGIVGFIVLVIGFILWVAMKKRKDKLQNISSMDYQNLPEHHKGPMATPAQWNRPDGATHADPNSLDHLYSKPVPKNQRKKIETTNANQSSKPVYSNSTQISSEPTYASVHNDELTYASDQNYESTYAAVQNNEPTYAAVQNNECTYAAVQNNESTYASVQLSNFSQKDPTYANKNSLDYQNLSTLKNEAAYAKVAKKTRKDKNKDPSGTDLKVQNHEPSDLIYTQVYTELGKNNRYVNAHVTNDVEPAYCEIKKTK